MKLKYEPALLIGFINASLAALGLALGWSAEQTGLVVGTSSAIGAAYVAWQTNETWASAIIQATASVLAMAVGFGVDMSDEAAALIIGVVTAGLAMFNRTQVSPVAKYEVTQSEL